MKTRNLEQLRLGLRLVLVAIYLGFGVLHLVDPAKLMPIMPPPVPFPRAVILATGVCEVLGAAGLLIPATRWWAGVMLALYALCVWPANLYQAFAHIHLAPLPDSLWYHVPRNLFQPVMVWWALFAGKVISWPLAPRWVSKYARDGGRRG